MKRDKEEFKAKNREESFIKACGMTAVYLRPIAGRGEIFFKRVRFFAANPEFPSLLLIEEQKR